MPTLSGESAVAEKPNHGGLRKGAGRPKSADRKDGSVRIDKSVLSKIQWIAKARNVSVADYLTDMVRPQVERDFLRESRKLSEGDSNL